MSHYYVLSGAENRREELGGPGLTGEVYGFCYSLHTSYARTTFLAVQTEDLYFKVGIYLLLQFVVEVARRRKQETKHATNEGCTLRQLCGNCYGNLRETSFSCFVRLLRHKPGTKNNHPRVFHCIHGNLVLAI